MSRFHLKSVLIATLCLSPAVLTAQDNSEPPKVAAYLTDTTIGFARVRLDQLDLEPVQELSKQYGGAYENQVQQIDTMISMMHDLQKQFVDAGATDLYIAVELENLLYGPYLLLEFKPGADVNALTGLLQDVVQKVNLPAAKQYKTLDGFLFAGDEEILKNITAGYVAGRPQLAAALTAVETDPLQIVICPSPDQLRAVREAVPAFPEPFSRIDGRFLARGVQFVSVGLHLKPAPGFRLVVQSADAETADVLLQAEQVGMSMITQLIRAEASFPGLEMLSDKLQMQRENDRLLLDFRLQPDELEKLNTLLTKPLKGMRQSARERVIINDLKQQMLAMHNWHDVYKVFPAHANYSKDGKPLLSWRVHVLPFLGQQELYQKFHLDEPWDSEHNKSLISQMPNVFEVDGSTVASEGKTGYVFPILKDGSGITSGTKDGNQIREINDGTSNTAMIVVADDEHSVIWTKPDDLVIDSEKPLAGLRFESKGSFHTAFADGSVRNLSKTIDPKLWISILTRDGGEVINEIP